jgi:hypothetical protein
MKQSILKYFATEKLSTNLVKKFLIADIILIALTFVVLHLQGRI